MRNQSVGNKIMPLKSLLEHKQLRKNQTLTNPQEALNFSIESLPTPKQAPSSSRTHTSTHKHNISVRDRVRGLAVSNHRPAELPSAPQTAHLPDSPFSFKDCFGSNPEHLRTDHRVEGSGKLGGEDTGIDLTPKRERAGEKAQGGAGLSLGQVGEVFRSVSLVRGSGEFFRENSFTLSKLQQQTWNGSRLVPSESIFKNDISKVKTELFHKEAQLFELSQKLEERDNTIRELSLQLAHAATLNHKLQQELASNSPHLDAEDTQRTLLLLKLRQHQVEEREWNQTLTDLKEREKRSADGYEKVLRAQKELLRQKEEQLEAARDRGRAKEAIIEDLSAEVSDLKHSLGQLQLRIREMIESQDELIPSEDVSALRRELAVLRQQVEERRQQVMSRRQLQSQLRSSLSAKEQQVIRARLGFESGEKSRRSPRRSSPGGEDEKELQRMKQLNCRLFKDNEKLSSMVRDLNSKLQQFYRLNRALNEQIMALGLRTLNNGRASD